MMLELVPSFVPEHRVLFRLVTAASTVEPKAASTG
jgi:hypothetical protein